MTATPGVHCKLRGAACDARLSTAQPFAHYQLRLTVGIRMHGGKEEGASPAVNILMAWVKGESCSSC